MLETKTTLHDAFHVRIPRQFVKVACHILFIRETSFSFHLKVLLDVTQELP